MAVSCPILWESKLQSETANSTLEANIIALANHCCDLFPIMAGVSIKIKAISPPLGNIIIPISIHEDNAEVLVLNKSPLSKFRS